MIHKHLKKNEFIFVLLMMSNASLAMEKLTPSQYLQLKHDETTLKDYFNARDIDFFKNKFPEIKKRKGELVRYALSARKYQSGLATFDLLHGIVCIYKTSNNGKPIKGVPALRVTLEAFELMITNIES